MNEVADAKVRRSLATDLAAIQRLLLQAELPIEDIASAPGLQFWVVEVGDALVGSVGLERFEAGGLLRSLVVAPALRRRGLARQLVVQLESDARVAGVEQLVLLTETAELFFHQLGYRVIDREFVPTELKQSQQFRSLCPASALCMTKSVVAGH